jgi:CP family cyanate transporter-like MFS transporter
LIEPGPPPATAGEPSSPPAAAPRYRWTILGLFWSRDILTVLGVNALPVLLPLMRVEWGLTALQAGLLAGITWQVIAALSLPLSAWLTRYSPRALLLWTGFYAAAFAAFQALAPSFELEYLARFGFVLLLPVQTAIGSLVLQQWFQAREVPAINGQTWGIRAVAQSAAVAVAPFLILAVGTWRGVFLVQAALLLAWTAVWLFAGRDRITPEYQARLRAAAARPLRAIFRVPRIWIIASAQSGSSLAFAAYMTFWPTYAREARGLPLETVGLVVAFSPLASAAGAFSAPWFGRRLGTRGVLVISGIGQVIAYLGLVVAEAPPLHALMFFLAGFFTMLPTPLVYAAPYAYRGISPREVPVMIALVNTIAVGGAAIGPVGVGALAELSRSLPLALTLSAFACLTCTFLGALFPDTSKLRAFPEPGSP